MSTHPYAPVDIHECPEIPSLEYKIAVMQAALAGKRVEFIRKHRPVEDYESRGWLGGVMQDWNWDQYAYRIARPKIAEGFNPYKLTEDDVGVKDGYRLLTIEELRLRQKPCVRYHGIEVEQYRLGDRIMKDSWSKIPATIIGFEKLPTRTKQPPGFFLPEPVPPIPTAKKLVPWTFETRPAGSVWIRTSKDGSWASMVIGWSHAGAHVGQTFLKWLELSYCQWSADGQTDWAPCGTEVQS